MIAGVVAFLAAVFITFGHAESVAASSCNEALNPGGWSRTTIWVEGQNWTASGLSNNSYRAEVHETNRGGAPCIGSDGVRWWGSWRRPPIGVGRSSSMQDPGYGANRVDREQWPSSIVGIAIPTPPQGLYAAGEWYPSYDPNGNGYEDVFRHDDVHVWNVPPPPTPTPTPIPTATPQPGVLAISVIACGNPFQTRIQLADNSQGFDGVSSASFSVNQGQTVTVLAAGYGDYHTTTALGRAGQSITINMNRLSNAGPCGVNPSPTPALTPTIPPPSCPGAPAIPNVSLSGNLDTQSPGRLVPVGTNTFSWGAIRSRYGQGMFLKVRESHVPFDQLSATQITALPILYAYDQPADRYQYAINWNPSTSWTNDGPPGAPYYGDLAGIYPFTHAGQGVILNNAFRHAVRNSGANHIEDGYYIVTDGVPPPSFSNHWRNFWELKPSGPNPELGVPTVAGRYYRVEIFGQSTGCGQWQNGLVQFAYFRTTDPSITISLRRATMAGADAGPIANQPITWHNPTLGTNTTLRSDANGNAVLAWPTTMPGAPNNYINLRPDLAETDFVWKIEGSCTTQPGVMIGLDAGPAGPAGALRNLTAGGCSAIFYYIQIPTIDARVQKRNVDGIWQIFSGGTLSLLGSQGGAIAQVTPGMGATTFSLTGNQLRPRVGQLGWTLMYSPPPPPAYRMYEQIDPTPGTNSVVDSDTNALRFIPGNSVGNVFNLVETANPTFATVRGHVELKKIDGTTVRGPFGSVSLRNTGGSRVTYNIPVSADGAFEARVPMATPPMTTNITLSFNRMADLNAYVDEVVGTGTWGSTNVSWSGNRGTLQIDVPSTGGTALGYIFRLRELPPPPPVPIPNGTMRPRYHGYLDPAKGVTLADSPTMSWPHAETGDFMPYVELQPLGDPPLGYRYEQEVVAWSYNGSMGIEARKADGLGRTGCRPGADEPPAGTDTSLLRGCVFRYRDNPSAAQMGAQARLHWSVPTAPNVAPNVYAYRLSQIRAIDMKVSALVETRVVFTATGQTWKRYTVMDGTFVINLLTVVTTK